MIVFIKLYNVGNLFVEIVGISWIICKCLCNFFLYYVNLINKVLRENKRYLIFKGDWEGVFVIVLDLLLVLVLLK